MIYIDRNSVDCPVSLLPGGEGERELAQLSTFIDQQEEHRQQRFHFRNLRKTDVFPAVLQLFSEKCSYCETPVISMLADIDHFRPRASVAEDARHPGYWWLANRWDNIFLACRVCNAAKSNRFPLEDEKLRAFIVGGEVYEQPLLLDPTADNPAEHFVYDEGGFVASDTLRGQTTIAQLRLNRASLVIDRKKTVQHILARIEQLKNALLAEKNGEDNKELVNTCLWHLQDLTDKKSPYSAIKRQFLVYELSGFYTAKDFSLHFEWSEYNQLISKRNIVSVKNEFRGYLDYLSDFSLNNSIGNYKSRMLRRSIEHIEINNFKSIEKMSLSVQPEWLMLLGENGAGKSSVLQAIALCIAGANHFSHLVDKELIIPQELIKKGKRTATISIQLSGFVGKHELILRRGLAKFRRPAGRTATVTWEQGETEVTGDREAKDEQQVLLGYGATRLLPVKNHQYPAITSGDYRRIDNLFDPFVTLIPAEEWLVKAPEHLFNQAALLLKDLLSLDDGVLFIKQKGRIMVSSPAQEISLRVLSDGFKAVIALTVDIISVATRLWGSPENAEGIVLLDELDCHLHPTWKMRIVSGLRRAFPGMQFITTTHDPLCLRGLEQGEICLMEKDDSGKVTANTDLPDPADLRVDQLLTSPFFGLNTTRDPQDEVLFDEYYALLSLSERDDSQNAKLAQLKSELKARRYVGDTPREQLMFEAVDQVIADHRESGTPQVYEMKEEVVEVISALWDDVLNETFTDHDKD